MSFLDNLKTEYESSMESQSAEAQLANTASLITSLQATQNERLSAPPPQHFAAMPKPGAQELKLAEQIQSNLLNMTKRLQPKDVVPEDAVRMLLGIPKVKEESPDNNAAAATAVSSNPTVPPPVVNLERA